MDFLTIMVDYMQARTQPFDLGAVKRAIANPRGFTITPNARRDANNLGYDIDRVKELLAGLSEADFHGIWTLRKDGKVILDNSGQVLSYDVYKPKIVAPNGDECEIYLKINYTDGRICITSVQSFHLDR